MAEANRIPVSSERMRQLQQLSHTAAQSERLDRDLPKDTRIKHILIRASGGIVTTFGSGTPVASEFGPFADLVDRIEVNMNGSRVVKSIKPWFLNYQQFLYTGHRAERAASAGASLTNYPVTDVTSYPFGTTGQITSIRESILLSFECVHLSAKKEQFWLNTKGASSAVLTIVTTNTDSAGSGTLGFGNTCPLVSSASTVKFGIFLIEQQENLEGMPNWDWRQTCFEKTYAAQSSSQPIDLPRGARLLGLMAFTRNGAAGSATTATGKVAKSQVITNWALWKDGKEIIKSGTFYSQQADNRLRYGFNAAMASSVSQADGFAYFDFWSNDGRGDIDTAIDARVGQCDSLQFIIDTGAAADVSYTNPVSVWLMPDELVELAS